MDGIQAMYRNRRSAMRILLGLAAIVLVASVAVYLWLFKDLPSPANLSAGTVAPSTILYDRRGRVLYEIMDPHVGRHQPLPLAEIPAWLRKATVATEDASFYQNPGVDLRAILRAVWINLRGGEVLSGGSTITQQLARNLLLSPQERSERTLARKLRESILAYRLARTSARTRSWSCTSTRPTMATWPTASRRRRRPILANPCASSTWPSARCWRACRSRRPSITR